MGLWSFWTGGSAIAAAVRGKNIGSGYVYDSQNGGDQLYSSQGQSVGLGLGLNWEAGIYTGSLQNASNVATLGILWGTIGFVWGDDGFGIVLGAAPPLASIPFELSWSFAIETDYVYKFDCE